MTDEDEIRERIAIEVEHLQPAYAQIIYDRRVAEMEKDDTYENNNIDSNRRCKDNG